MIAGVACSVVPDLDVLGFRLGIHYEDLLGHRGLSHSIAFAAGLASLVLIATKPKLNPPVHRGLVWFYLFLATASHGLLDALTNGGLGVALLSPFITTRYFFPFTPIEVSPLGLRFFSAGGLAVLMSECCWVWFPAIAFAVAAVFVRRLVARLFTSGNPS